MRILITIATGLALSLLLSACAAPTHLASPPTAAPTTQIPAGPPPADLQLAHLQQAAYNYARYHQLAPDIVDELVANEELYLPEGE